MWAGGGGWNELRGGHCQRKTNGAVVLRLEATVQRGLEGEEVGIGLGGFRGSDSPDLTVLGVLLRVIVSKDPMRFTGMPRFQ